MIKELILWLRRHHPGTVVRLRDFWIQYSCGALGIVPLSATLSATLVRCNGEVRELGIVSTHAVTDAFVAALVDTLQSSVATFSNYKYHDSGTGTTAEAEADTAMETTCGEARDTGTQVDGAAGAWVYKSVATHTYAGTFAVTEHGLFNVVTGGTLMDRSRFTAINVIKDDKIEFTYELTCASGG